MLMVLLLIFLIIIITVLRLNSKQKLEDRNGNNGTKNVKIRLPLKYLGNFRRTLEMLLINCEINLILTCYFENSMKCFW